MPYTNRWFWRVSAAVILALVVTAAPASARHRERGFEPSPTVLECIRGPWGARSMESRGDYGAVSTVYHRGRWVTYFGAYQGTAEFMATYSALIPADHWVLWDTQPTDPPNTWHPMIQDETARNAIRVRGLGPWPTPRRVCPRA